MFMAEYHHQEAPHLWRFRIFTSTAEASSAKGAVETGDLNDASMSCHLLSCPLSYPFNFSFLVWGSSGGLIRETLGLIPVKTWPLQSHFTYEVTIKSPSVLPM